MYENYLNFLRAIFGIKKPRCCRECGIQIEKSRDRQNLCNKCYRTWNNQRTKSSYARNRDKRREYSRKCYTRNPLPALQAQARYNKRNSEKVKQRVKRYQLANPDKMKILWKKREYRERSAIGNFTIEEWQAKLKEYGDCCAYCFIPLNGGATIDHVIPLSKGGTNYIDNLVPACRSCNSKKSNKPLKVNQEEFTLLV